MREPIAGDDPDAPDVIDEELRRLGREMVDSSDGLLRAVEMALGDKVGLAMIAHLVPRIQELQDRGREMEVTVRTSLDPLTRGVLYASMARQVEELDEISAEIALILEGIRPRTADA